MINAQERAQDKQTTLLEGIGKGITGLSDGLLKGLAALKDKGFGAFGLIDWCCRWCVRWYIRSLVKLPLSSKFCQRC